MKKKLHGFNETGKRTERCMDAKIHSCTKPFLIPSPLREKLDALERSNKDQLSSLRVVVEKQEANIAEKEKLNSELEQKLGQHAAMISMIQNITTGTGKKK